MAGNFPVGRVPTYWASWHVLASVSNTLNTGTSRRIPTTSLARGRRAASIADRPVGLVRAGRTTCADRRMYARRSLQDGPPAGVPALASIVELRHGPADQPRDTSRTPQDRQASAVQFPAKEELGNYTGALRAYENCTATILTPSQFW